jgi:transposase
MSAERISMRQIREALRLAHEAKLGRNQISKALGLSKCAVSAYLKRAAKAELSWPLPAELDDAALERRLFPAQKAASQCVFAPLNFEDLLNELKMPGVTLQLLWEEYQGANPGGAYQYSQFCFHFRQWQDRLKVTMRQVHKAGEKMFVDYVGPTVEVIDAKTGEVREAQIFVAVLGASNYTFAEATWTQNLHDWVSSHERAWMFFGGVSEVTVPDNLKSGVTIAHRYDPELNSTYWALAEHYGTVVIPARPYKPRDKAKVEAGVLVVERWIIARLRHQQFFSLGELNEAIRKLLVSFNTRPFKKIAGCRLSQFEILDKPVLKPLPGTPFEFFHQQDVRVGFNYHIEIEGHHYSAPWTLAKRVLKARITARTVEFLYQGRRVVLHQRSYHKGLYTTVDEHMPDAHRAQTEWNPGRFLNWAKEIGPNTVKVTQGILNTPRHVQQAYKYSLGLLNLSKRYGRPRLEAACERAICLKADNLRSVEKILKSGFDSQPLPPTFTQEEMFEKFSQHTNLRGADYYAA